ncbi:threonine synthase [Rubellicoccus peritrichatus]|uniref:Threonine synthase n=1 Tax=Rubellicoccus peritrichatus TaxID=3080537 RepID=A0AAQ3QWF0_9BACT|nr:threonine synthase [Puniceicoccus sp. CR14]WOO42633.1 threonine synthase [Puniceicoccus sp. CR14]
MQFISTRGQSEPLEFSAAVEAGLAPDGGLYLPDSLPDISSKLSEWERYDYARVCFEFMRLFATDYDESELQRIIGQSYKKFADKRIAPLVQLDEKTHVLELFHGPTLAFKDFALQLLGNLYEAQIKRTGSSINVLGATSGDTGSAAIHGLLGKEGVNIFILYPDGRVSPLQERQMTTTGATNVYPISITGSFDDGQAAVKDLFGDLEFKAEYHLSAINSINLARILAQCVYYIWAWLRLPEAARANLEFVVPTGNFGNVLAGWLTQQMGLPVSSFRVATNQNDILYRLFTTGTYAVDDVKPSLAPSMDIQIASNFERFLFYKVGQNPEKVRELMKQMRETGKVDFDAFDPDSFTTSRSEDGDIERLIKEVHERYNYIVDPHTACGFQTLDPDKTSVILSTASPAKFPDVIESAIGIHPTVDSLEKLKTYPIVTYPLPADKEAIRAFIKEHVSSGEKQEEKS